MSYFRKNPLFAGVLTLCALAVLAELGLIYERWSTARATAAQVTQRTTELMAMREVAPTPTREVARTIEADLARAQQALAAMQAELKGHGPAAEKVRTAKVPAARTDAFFDLATFVERTREAARKNEVEVRPEAARFGFAAYAHAGPEVERIEPVFRQRLIAQYLIESLFEAKPKALLSVKREPPLTKKEREERDAALAAAAQNGAPADGSAPADPAAEPVLPEGPDFFLIDPHASARVPGYVDGMAFRLVFTGETAALRTLLNRLASFELPVLVREVEVEPATSEESSAGEDAAAAPAEPAAAPASIVLNTEPPKPAAPKPGARAAAAPIVTRALSKFTVTVEYIELVPPPAGDPAATPPSS
jgi:hypothetical protein